MPLAVVIVEAVPDAIHGSLSRWLMQVSPSTYVGHLSQRVREQLWEEIEPILKDGRATAVFPDENEQGYSVWCAGASRLVPLDLDGLTVMARLSSNETVTTP